MQLENRTNNLVILPNLSSAANLWQRTAGLLALPPLGVGEGLLLQPCTGIHTWFMRYPIDVIFLDKHGVVIKVVENLRPFRIAGPLLRARSIIEMAPGTLRRTPVTNGDRLTIRP